MANYQGYMLHIDTSGMEKKIKQIMQVTDDATQTALKAVGEAAVAYASVNITKQKAVDTGWLRDHIDYRIKGDAVYVGSNVHYAIYVEFGTGDMGTGTGPKWTYYVPEGKYKGFHQTSGMRPRPFLRPAATDKHCIKEYTYIFTETLREANKEFGKS